MKNADNLPYELRRLLEIMANTPSNIDMEFWNEFSNAILEAANTIERSFVNKKMT